MERRKLLVDVGEPLEERARSRFEPDPTITYGDLVKRFNLPKFTSGNWENHPLSGILGALNEDDHAANWPFRSVLVVNVKTNMSGDLFFWAVSQLRYGGIKIPKPQQTAYWYLERELLLKYWRTKNACQDVAVDPTVGQEYLGCG